MVDVDTTSTALNENMDTELFTRSSAHEDMIMAPLLKAIRLQLLCSIA